MPRKSNKKDKKKDKAPTPSSGAEDAMPVSKATRGRGGAQTNTAGAEGDTPTIVKRNPRRSRKRVTREDYITDDDKEYDNKEKRTPVKSKINKNKKKVQSEESSEDEYESDTVDLFHTPAQNKEDLINVLLKKVTDVTCRLDRVERERNRSQSTPPAHRKRVMFRGGSPPTLSGYR